MSVAIKNPAARSTLLLVRHAHTDMAGRFCGLSDPPLTAQGLAQLPELHAKLNAYPVTHICSSGLQRARQTAEFLAEQRQLKVTHYDVLNEIFFGSWEGLNWDEVMARDAKYAQRWVDNYPSVPAPGGEYFEDFFERVQYAMTAIAGWAEGGCAVVVTHAGVIRTFLASLERQNGGLADIAACDYAGFRAVSYESGEWRLNEHDPKQTAMASPRVTLEPLVVVP